MDPEELSQAVWMDSAPNRVINAGIAWVGYLFFWATELILLYWLVKELASKSRTSFAVAGGVVLAWTLLSTYVTVRLHASTRQVRTLYLTKKGVGVSGKHPEEFAFSEVDKVIIAHAGEGFEAVITSNELMITVPIRDRKGFLEAAKKIEALRGKVASTGVLDK